MSDEDLRALYEAIRPLMEQQARMTSAEENAFPDFYCSDSNGGFAIVELVEAIERGGFVLWRKEAGRE